MTQTEDGTTAPGLTAGRRVRVADDRTTWWGRAIGSFTTPLGLLALVLIGVQSLWRGTALTEGHFTQGDYLLPLEADGATLGWSYLVGQHGGEFSPVGRLLSWLTVSVGGLGWGSVVVVVALLQAVAGLLLWVVLTQVLDQRWVRVPLLGIGLFSPLTLVSTFSWSQASMYLPAAVLLLLGLSALLSHLQDDWEPGPLLAGLVFSLLLLTSDRVVLMPLVAFVLVAAMLPSVEGGVARRLATAATTYLRLWLWLVAFLVVRSLVSASQGGGSFALPTSLDEAVDIVQTYARQGLTGLVGGPWVGDVSHGVLSPEASWPMGAGIVLCLLLAVPLIRAARNPSVRIAVVGLAIYFLLGAIVLVMTRQGFDAFGMIPRFLGDVVVVVVVLVAVALRGAVVPEQARALARRLPGATALVVLIAFVASATVTTRALLPALLNEDDRAFFAEIAKGLDADPRIVLLDGQAPENIIHPWFGSASRMSSLARLLPQQPPFDVPSEHLRMVDVLGILRPMGVAGVTAEPGTTPNCGHAVSTEQARIPMSERVPEGRVVMELAYYVGGDNYLLVEAPGQSIRIAVQEGARRIQVPVTGGFDELRMRIESVGASVCVADVIVGPPLPTALSGTQ